MIRFAEGEGNGWEVGAGRVWGKCSACSCRGHTRNRIIDSLNSTPVLLPLLVSFSAGDARDEANQGIMEELHTCAASPMLYYINRARVQSDLPFKFI